MAMDFSASAPPTGTFQPGTAAAATSVVELSFSARNLRDMDVFSKSDPVCVVFIKPFGSQKWSEIKRTECIKNNLNPHWVTKVQMNYMFEEQQPLKFAIFDLDSNSVHLDDHDFIGSSETSLGQIVSNGSVILDLVNPEYARGTNGSLVVTCEELSMCKDELHLQFLGKKLDKKDFFGSSDPFLVFSRSNEGGSYTVVHKSEHLKNNINPCWKAFLVSVRTLCNGDHDRNIKVECFDHNNSGNHSLIGEFYITVRQLLQGPGPENVYDCINPKKRVSDILHDILTLLIISRVWHFTEFHFLSIAFDVCETNLL